ncbi:MAG: hypothetical protein WAX66_03605 [Patescibacteria group bacterium]|jgi:hypothetical protein
MLVKNKYMRVLLPISEGNEFTVLEIFAVATTVFVLVEIFLNIIYPQTSLKINTVFSIVITISALSALALSEVRWLVLRSKEEGDVW